MKAFFLKNLWIGSLLVLMPAQALNIKFQLNPLPLNDSIKIEVFKCYISNLKIETANGQVINCSPDVFLLTLSDTITTQSIEISSDIEGKSFISSSIHFDLGLDSQMNTSGALNGALDPLNGMFWTWQSGYIHLKIEGHSLRASDNQMGFEYHLGGYRKPYETQCHQMIFQNSNDMFVVIDLTSFFEAGTWKKTPRLMSPGPQAKHMFDRCCGIFKTNKP